MISFDFEYIRPSTLQEAVESYLQLSRDFKRVLYYSGGTEILSFARNHRIKVDALIDIKAIPECRSLRQQQNKIIYGAALTLNEIVGDNSLPLLTSAFKGIADHTLRNRLTLGGNICGNLTYREAVLPLMLTEAEVRIVGEKGVRCEKLNLVFDKSLRLEKGELLIDIAIEKTYREAEFCCIRKIKQGEVDYPILHIEMLKGEGLRVAFSGVLNFPFRSDAIDAALNASINIDERIAKIIKLIPGNIKQDQWASSRFRQMLLEKALRRAYTQLGGV